MARQYKKITTQKRPASPRSVRRGRVSSKRPFFAPHKHTFRLLPHGHTSYPLLFLLMLFVGVLLASWTEIATGLDYTVTAKVPAAPLTEPATITNPISGSNVETAPTVVDGRCPIGSYVKLYRNGYFSGVVICSSSGTFQLQTDLFKGANSLLAQDYNVTDDAGPVSPAVTVYYKPPALVASQAPAASSSKPEPSTASEVAVPLLLTSEFQFQGYYVGQQINWQFSLAGGTAPYAVHIDWGDGKGDTLSRPAAGTFIASHQYVRLPGNRGVYTIKAEAVDSGGNKGFVQLVAIVNPRPDASSGASPLGSGGSGTSAGGAIAPIIRLVKMVSPTYFAVMAVLIGFWLGERREYERLRPWFKGRRKHHA